MKLTPHSELILRNFASINSNLFVRAGNYIKTKSPMAELVVEAELDVKFPREFGIFDMKQFLASVELIEDPSLDFGDRSVTIHNEMSSVKYNYADMDALNVYEGTPKIPDTKVSFVLRKDQLDSLKKAASVLHHEDIAFINVDGKLAAQVDTVNSMNKNVSRNSFNINLGIDVEGDFKYVVKLSQLVMIPGDYAVEFASGKRDHFAKFKLVDHPNLTYWMGLQRKESYYND